ncbi:MAG: AAA family ATPase [Deltaproteobacteria bacterium]|nr:AAA family ATPase [Deltaproteobacteria bacterium]
MMASSIETLASYVPWQISPGLTDSNGSSLQPLLDRFPASILFVDIVGFTPFVERLTREGQAGVEILSRLINSFFGELIDLITKYGGVVVKFVGDGLIAVWPAGKLSISATARDAIDCACELRNKMNNRLIGDESRLFLKVNVEAGETISAILGGQAGQWRILVSGEPFARLAACPHNLRPGDVVASRQTLGAAGDDYSVNEIAKGFFRVIDKNSHRRSGDRAATTLPPPNDAVLRACIPQVVLSRLDAGQGDWLAELRRPTVVFISVPGLDYASPALLTQLQELTIRIQRVLFRYEATLLEIGADDKGTVLVAAFGLPPLIHEDDALRGARAAQEIQRGLAALGICAAIGMTTGRMFCGPIGNVRRRQYTLYGDEMNIAARLMQAGQHLGDGIYCDEQTYQAARRMLNFQRLPPIALKGKAESIRAYRLSGNELQSARRSPLLGRQTERRALTESLEAFVNHTIDSTILLVEGDPGIGKSRLIQELTESASHLHVRGLVAGTEAFERLTSYYVWRAIFSQLFAIADVRDSSERRRRVSLKLNAVLSSSVLAPLLNTLFPLDFPENEVTSLMTGEVRADNLNGLLVSLLQKRAEETPLLIVIEDAHWMDSASWTLAIRVASEVKPLLFTISSRPLADSAPVEYQRLIRHSNARRLSLDSLGEDDSLELICLHLGVPAVSKQIENFVKAQAEGNPFFIEQLCRSLRERELIVLKDGIGEVRPDDGGLEKLDLPGTIHDVLASRLGQLEASQQMILKVAAVIGRMFPVEALRDIYPIADDQPNLMDHLERLEHLHLIRLEDTQPPIRYSFRHVIIQQAAYDMMLLAQRRQLHEAVAAWYEWTFAEDLAPHFELLAHHWSEAGNTDKAVAYNEKAGERALATFSSEEACYFLKRAIQLERDSAQAADRHRQARRELNLGGALVTLGNYVEGKLHLEKGLVLLGHPLPATRVGQVLGLFHEGLRQICHRAWRRHMTSQGSSRGEELDTACHAYLKLIEVYIFGGQPARYAYSSITLLNSAETGNIVPMIAVGSSLVAGIFILVRFRRAAEAYLQRALETTRTFEDIEARTFILAVIGYASGGTGDWKRFERAFGEIVETSGKFAYRRRLADGLNSLIYLHLLQGHYGSLAPAVEALAVAVDQLDDPRYQVYLSAGRTYFYLHGGDFERALECILNAHSVVTAHPEIGDLNQKLEVYGLMSVAYLRASQIDKAIESADRALELSRGCYPSIYHAFSGYTGPTEVCLTLWEREPGRGDLAELARRACRQLRRYARVFPIGEPYFQLSLGRYYWLRGKRTKARAAWRHSLTAANRLSMLYEQGRAQYEIAQHLESRSAERQAHLKSAQQIFTECGETYYRDRVAEAISIQ